MSYQIAVLPGDGIGPEVVAQALRVLDKVRENYGHKFNYTEALVGGSAYDATGTPLPDETLAICKASDAVLLGAVGGTKWDHLKGADRPESGLLKIRKALNLYANIRPAVLFDALKNACPLRADIVGQGLDICIVRELTGGIYFGERGRTTSNNIEEAFDTMRYNKAEVERIAHKGFNIARKRKSKLSSIDKMNVLESSRLWRETVIEVSSQYPDVELNHVLVDNAAMQLVMNPSQFDVIITGNMFGDIISDEASMLTGSLGMLPSASLSDCPFGLYAPSHASARGIAV